MQRPIDCDVISFIKLLPMRRGDVDQHDDVAQSKRDIVWVCMPAMLSLCVLVAPKVL